MDFYFTIKNRLHLNAVISMLYQFNAAGNEDWENIHLSEDPIIITFDKAAYEISYNYKSNLDIGYIETTTDLLLKILLRRLD